MYLSNMKLYIEDLICRLASAGPYLFDPALSIGIIDRGVVQSLSQNPAMGKGYSEKQRSLVIRICSKYKNQLATALGPEAYIAIDNPEFKFPIVQPMSQEKTVSVIGKEMVIKFPYNESIVNNLRKFRDSTAVKTAVWDPENRHWTMAFEEQNILWVSNNLIDAGFVTDELFNTASMEISEILEKIEDFVPMLVEENGLYQFVNVHSSVPQPNTSDVVSALLMAKYYGISVWDEMVSKTLKNGNFSPILEDFLNESAPNTLEFDSAEFSLDHFTDLFKHNIPAMIIIPPGNELASLKSWFNWLKTQNFTEKDMSVMFRLDNANGATFNELIKSAGLNNPIHAETKIVFISQKVPKPLIKANVDFKIIVNLGSLSGVHYSLTSFLADRMDVVRYTDKTKLGYQFGLL